MNNIMLAEITGLYVRESNLLKNNGIDFVGELTSMTEAEILRLPNGNRTSLDKINTYLSDRNLSLGSTLEFSSAIRECLSQGGSLGMPLKGEDKKKALAKVFGVEYVSIDTELSKAIISLDDVFGHDQSWLEPEFLAAAQNNPKFVQKRAEAIKILRSVVKAKGLKIDK